MPAAAEGGRSATATITPTSALGRPAAIDNAAAPPEASASATASRPKTVRAASSGL